MKGKMRKILGLAVSAAMAVSAVVPWTGVTAFAEGGDDPQEYGYWSFTASGKGQIQLNDNEPTNTLSFDAKKIEEIKNNDTDDYIYVLPEEGYGLAGWTGGFWDCNTTIALDNLNPAKDIWSMATFSPLVEVTLDAGEHGTLAEGVSPTEEYPSASKCKQIYLTPDDIDIKEGYELVGWKDSYGKDYSPTQSLEVSSDWVENGITFTAQYEAMEEPVDPPVEAEKVDEIRFHISDALEEQLTPTAASLISEIRLGLNDSREGMIWYTCAHNVDLIYPSNDYYWTRDIADRDITDENYAEWIESFQVIATLDDGPTYTLNSPEVVDIEITQDHHTGSPAEKDKTILNIYLDIPKDESAEYLVTYALGSGMDESLQAALPASQTVTDNEGDGETFEANKPQNAEGYTFDGWYMDKDFGTKFEDNGTIIKGDTTLYGKWTAEENPPAETTTIKIQYVDEKGILLDSREVTVDGETTGATWLKDNTNNTEYFPEEMEIDGKTYVRVEGDAIPNGNIITAKYELKESGGEPEEPETYPVVLNVYKNGATEKPVKSYTLDSVEAGTEYKISGLDSVLDEQLDEVLNKFAAGYEYDGFYNDGGWNQYKAGNPDNVLADSVTVNGWTNIHCMVWEEFQVNYHLNGELWDTDTFTQKDIDGGWEFDIPENATGFSGWYEKESDITEKPGNTISKPESLKKYELYGTVELKTYPVVLRIYKNGDMENCVKAVTLAELEKGASFDLSSLPTMVRKYFEADKFAAGFVCDGYYTDGGWNGDAPALNLDEDLTINGWTNIHCMVWEKFPVNYHLNGELWKSETFTQKDINAGMEFDIPENVTGFSGWYEKSADIGDPNKAITAPKMLKKYELYATTDTETPAEDMVTFDVYFVVKADHSALCATTSSVVKGADDAETKANIERWAADYKDKAVNQFSGYEMVEYLVKDEGSGSFDVVYYYRLKDGTNPYKSITVYYVDEDGNAIDDPYVVKNVPVNTSVTKWAGDEANKREYLYDEIYTEDGLYEFVTYAAKDEDNIINVYYRLKGATDPEDPDDPDNSGDDDRRPPYIPPTGNSDRDDNDNDTTTINDDDTALAPGPGDGTSSAPGGEMGDAVPGTPGGANPGDPSEVIGDDAVPQVEAPQTGRQVAGSLALLAGAAVVATLTLRRKKK